MELLKALTQTILFEAAIIVGIVTFDSLFNPNWLYLIRPGHVFLFVGMNWIAILTMLREAMARCTECNKNHGRS